MKESEEPLCKRRSRIIDPVNRRAGIQILERRESISL